MNPLPDQPDINHLKKQAKDLLKAYRQGSAEAVRRLQTALPLARGKSPEALRAMELRLHDAQSCIAREYGLSSWADLRSLVEVMRLRDSDAKTLAAGFSRLVYAGEIAGGMNRARPNAAARLLAEHPGIARHDPWLACATGEHEIVRRNLAEDPSWVERPGGPLSLTPLIATTHSSLLTLPEYRDGLHRVAALLLAAGANPNGRQNKEWSVRADTPPETWQASPLHGAAGVNHDPELTRMLLAAGADPNDGESLYHSLDTARCTKLLLDAGATVTGTNVLFRALDFDDLDTFRLLLSHAADTPELSSSRLLFWAIRRRRSLAHVAALLEAGIDPRARNKDGLGAEIQALRYGLPEVAALLREAGADTPLAPEEQFLAACARGDEEEARRLQAANPGFPAALDDDRLRIFPELAAAGCGEAVRLMADLGWPLEVRGGDFDASALNQAVFRGDAALARHLLASGASWKADHAYGDNVCGTLSWASVNRPVENGDWAGCAEALLAHGMPAAERDPGDPDIVLIDGRKRRFADEVTALLLGEDAGAGA